MEDNNVKQNYSTQKRKGSQNYDVPEGVSTVETEGSNSNKSKRVNKSKEKQLLTPEQLDSRIKELVLTHDRLEIIELVKLLESNADAKFIDRRIQLLAEEWEDLEVSDGQLFTQMYLDLLCEQVDQLLEQENKINISELAKKFCLSSEFIIQTILSRIPEVVKGELHNNTVLTTLNYKTTFKDYLKSILKASTQPMEINDIKNQYKFLNLPINEIIHTMVEKRELDGRLINNTYMSTKFIEEQDKSIRTFFKENGFIEYEYITKNLHIINPKEFLREMFTNNEGVALHGCYYSQSELSNLKQNIIDLLQSDGYIELKPIIPTVFNERDTQLVLSKHVGAKDCVIKDDIMFANDFLDKCSNVFKDEMIKKIYENPYKLISADNEDQDKGANKGKKQHKKKGNKGAAKVVQADTFENSDVITHLRKNSLFPKEYEPDLEDALCSVLKERLTTLNEKVRTELLKSKKSTAVDLVEELQGKVEEQISLLQAVIKSARRVEEVPNLNLTYLKEKMLDFAKPIIEGIILLHCRNNAIQLPQNWFKQDKAPTGAGPDPNIVNYKKKFAQMGTDSMFKTQDLVYQAVDRLPKDLSKTIRALCQLLTQRNIEGFMKELQKSADLFDLKIVNMEKKNESNVYHSQKFFILEAIQNCEFTEKEKFFYLVDCLALDQNLFFGLSYEDKALSVLSSVLFWANSKADDPSIKDSSTKVQEGLDYYSSAKVEELAKINQNLLATLS